MAPALWNHVTTAPSSPATQADRAPGEIERFLQMQLSHPVEIKRDSLRQSVLSSLLTFQETASSSYDAISRWLSGGCFGSGGLRQPKGKKPLFHWAKRL
ncbi:hypothetical protein [Roseicyclus sp.]|uniref:hypothetical protein n=1 Tax=Roseicyclus sp. TaxID=1914329 RepID=UPI003FA00C5F